MPAYQTWSGYRWGCRSAGAASTHEAGPQSGAGRPVAQGTTGAAAVSAPCQTQAVALLLAQAAHTAGPPDRTQSRQAQATSVRPQNRGQAIRSAQESLAERLWRDAPARQVDR